MKSLFQSASAKEISASTTKLQALIQMFRQNLLKGLIDTFHPIDNHLFFSKYGPSALRDLKTVPVTATDPAPGN
jgi:hypothetical protein